MKLGAVRYQPSALGYNAGLRTIVHGRLHTCPRPPTGPRLDEQGGISRGSLYVWGYVTHALLVPARNGRELAVLQAAAHAAVLSGDASEWALAAIHTRSQVYWAIHLGARPEVVAELAARVDAARTFEVREKQIGSWVKGAQISCLDREGQVTSVLEADTVFDDAPLPLFDAQWTQPETGRGAFARDEEPTVRNEEPRKSSARPVTLPDEDVEEVEEDEEYDDVVAGLDDMMVALLESVGVEIVEDDSARTERRA
jgi:hypothetical protein